MREIQILDGQKRDDPLRIAHIKKDFKAPFRQVTNFTPQTDG